MDTRRARHAFLSLCCLMLANGAMGFSGLAEAQSLYVANQDVATLSVINSLPGTLATTISTGAGPTGVAASANGQIVVVANSSDNTVTIISATSGTILGTVSVGNQPTGVAITADGTSAYVANSGDGTVSVVSTAKASVIAQINVGLSPFGVAISPNGQTVYVVNSFSNSVSVIAAGANSVSATIPVGASPSGVSVAPDGSKIYVSNSADNSVSVIATASNTLSSTIAVGAGPIGIATAPSGITYVANLEDGTVSALNAAATVAQTISIGGAPYGVTTSADGSTVYVVNKTAKLVSVISAATNTISGAIPVPGTPGSFGVFFGSGAIPQSALAAAILPSSRSVVVGNTATFMSTVLNTSGATVNNCQFALPSSAPAGLSLAYQTVSSGGQLTGQANQPISIAANQGQGFLLAFKSSATVPAVQQPLVITCKGTAPAPEIVGLDVPGLAFSTTATPDIVVLSATTSNDGIVATPVGAAAAFAAATYNVGGSGSLIATVDTQGLALPVTLTLCQSNPNTGACLATPTPSLTVAFATGGTPTFSVFLVPSAAIPFSPANYRVFLRFIDTNGVSHGSTSVAVRTL